MKLYIMTDMEGVAGVMNLDVWCEPDGKYYEIGKELLTKEINAAIDGFCSAGFDEVVVADGHGAGGINITLLDKRAEYMRGWPQVYPFLIDSSYAAVAWVGQHAKAGTEYSHLAHTGSCRVINYIVNGISIGELGQIGLCAAEFGVPAIFASGELALCKEAEALFPGIETVSVKYGTTPGTGEECDYNSYYHRNTASVHKTPERARELIYEGALKAGKRFFNNEFKVHAFKPPYEGFIRMRQDENNPRRSGKWSDSESIIKLFNKFPTLEPE